MSRAFLLAGLVLGILVLLDSAASAQAPPAILPPPSVVGPAPGPGVTYFSGPGVLFYSSPKGRLFAQTDLPATVYPAGYGAIYYPGFVSSYLSLGVFRPRGYRAFYRQGNIVQPQPFGP